MTITFGPNKIKVKMTAVAVPEEAAVAAARVEDIFW